MEATFCSPYINVTGISNVTIQVRDAEYDQSKKLVTLVNYIFLIFLTIPGNILVIIYMWKQKHFSSNFSVYATFLAVTDLSVGLFVLPLELVELVHPHWFSIVPTCIFVKLVQFVPTSVSIFLLDAIAYDRYICVTSPLLYRSHFTKMRSVVISIAMCISGCAIWIPYFLSQQFDDAYNVTVLGSCDSIFGYFTLGQAVLAYYLPTIFLVVVYIFLQRALKKRTILGKSPVKKRRRVYVVESEIKQDVKMDSFVKAECISEQMFNKIETDHGATVIPDKPVTTGAFSVGTQHAQSGRRSPEAHQATLSVENLPKLLSVDPRKSLSRRQLHIIVQNKTCFKTISVVVLAFILCWAPFFVIWPMYELSESRLFVLVYKIFVGLSYANSAINPFLYVFTSKSMRSDIMNMFKRRRLVS